jgi:hypothetical protein
LTLILGIAAFYSILISILNIPGGPQIRNHAALTRLTLVLLWLALSSLSKIIMILDLKTRKLSALASITFMVLAAIAEMTVEPTFRETTVTDFFLILYVMADFLDSTGVLSETKL